ncbi:hypothetical protein EOD23_05960 [Mesorhizobium sp. USDA-HM6]|nr:hypothetical protein EOD23_05960 [Mesorhizobium sp. USDA-HM6]
MKNKVSRLAAAFLSFPLGGVCAQQATADPKVSGIVIVDGPYELAGGGGVIGYVLTRKEKKANFQPCVGEVQLVDDADLNPTSLDCKNEPPKKEVPFNFACADAESQVAKVNAKGEDVHKVELGTVFLKSGDGYSVAKAPPPANDWVQWNAASAPPFSVCGGKYVYLPKVGTDEVWIGVVKGASQ